MDKEVIFKSCIDHETIDKVYEAAKELDVTLIYYNGMKWYADKDNAAIVKEQRITDVKIEIAPYNSLVKDWKNAKSCTNKIMAIGDEHVINQLQSRLLLKYQDSLNIYTSKPTYLEIMKKDASKKNALVYLLKKFNIEREESIAIGDNFNDLEMIIYAGLGIAMGNAPEVIKASADYVTDTNENDGVRKAIEKFIEL